MPYHGNNAKVFRPSHVITVLESVHDIDSEGLTSLHSACANGNIAVVKELLKFKSKVDVVTKTGHTPLHLAVYCGSYECVVELMKSKSDVNALTKSEKNSALHLACLGGFGRVAEFLIENGARVNGRNVVGRTPLHCAAQTGRVDVGQLLLRSGAEAQALDAHAWEPRQIAEMFEHRLFQELIIREGMGEKQTVIKELPPAKWHGKLWTDLSAMQVTKFAKHEKLMKLEKDLEDRNIRMAEEKVLKAKEDIKKQRQKELELQRKRLAELSKSSYYRANSNPVKPQIETDQTAI